MSIKPPSGYALEQAVATLQRALAEQIDEDGVLADPVEAEEDVRELLARVLRAAVDAETLADAVKQRMEDLRARQERFRARAENMRATAFAAMDALDLRKLELPDLTASIKANPPRVVITDEAIIPAELMRTVTTPDRAAIKAALTAGAPVPGAEMTNQIPTIQIRTR